MFDFFKVHHLICLFKSHSKKYQRNFKSGVKFPPISKMSLNSTPAILNYLFIQTDILRINDYKIQISINSDKSALGSIVPNAQSRFSILF